MCRQDRGLENVVGLGSSIVPELHGKNKTCIQKSRFGTVVGVVCTKTHMGPWVLCFRVKMTPMSPMLKAWSLVAYALDYLTPDPTCPWDSEVNYTDSRSR